MDGAPLLANISTDQLPFTGLWPIAEVNSAMQQNNWKRRTREGKGFNSDQQRKVLGNEASIHFVPSVFFALFMG